MTHTLSTYTERREDARARLTAALRPSGRGERELVDYLVNGLSTPGSLDTLTAMVERASGGRP